MKGGNVSAKGRRSAFVIFGGIILICLTVFLLDYEKEPEHPTSFAAGNFAVMIDQEPIVEFPGGARVLVSQVLDDVGGMQRSFLSFCKLKPGAKDCSFDDQRTEIPQLPFGEFLAGDGDLTEIGVPARVTFRVGPNRRADLYFAPLQQKKD